MSQQNETPAINLDHAPTRALLAELKPLVEQEAAAEAEAQALKRAADHANSRAWQLNNRVAAYVRAIAEINNAKVHWGGNASDYHAQATEELVLDALARLNDTPAVESEVPY